MRRQIFALLSAIGALPPGFLVPYRGVDKVPGPGEMADYAAIESHFCASEGAFLAHLDVIEEYAEALEKLGSEPPPAP